MDLVEIPCSRAEDDQLDTLWSGERFLPDRPRAGSRTIWGDKDLHRARFSESLESGGGIVDARDLRSQIGDFEPSVSQKAKSARRKID